MCLLLWIIITYNLLIRDRNRIKEAWSGIDVQLKRRHNLIPALVETVKAYSLHERSLFNEVTEKRAKSEHFENLREKATAETDLSGMLKNIFAVVEDYLLFPLTGIADQGNLHWLLDQDNFQPQQIYFSASRKDRFRQ